MSAQCRSVFGPNSANYPDILALVLRCFSDASVCSIYVSVLGKDEADTQSLTSDFVEDNRNIKCTHGETTCRTSVCQLLSKETCASHTQHQKLLVIINLFDTSSVHTVQSIGTRYLSYPGGNFEVSLFHMGNILHH